MLVKIEKGGKKLLGKNLLNMREEENTNNHFHSMFINHLQSITHIITTMEIMIHLWGVVMDSFCFCMDIFSSRWSMLVNLLNCDCLFSNLGVGKDHPLQHPVAEGEHTAAAN